MPVVDIPTYLGVAIDIGVLDVDRYLYLGIVGGGGLGLRQRYKCLQLHGLLRDVPSIFSRLSTFSHNARSAGAVEETGHSDGSEFTGEPGRTLHEEGASFDISGNEARLIRWSGEP